MLDNKSSTRTTFLTKSFHFLTPLLGTVLTLKPSSPGFSGSKSYRARHAGVCIMGDLAGDFMGDGRGEAVGPTRVERKGGEERKWDRWEKEKK